MSGVWKWKLFRTDAILSIKYPLWDHRRCGDSAADVDGSLLHAFRLWSHPTCWRYINKSIIIIISAINRQHIIKAKRPYHVNILRRTIDTGSEAHLGMFSMFGRTGAPQKWGPHMRTKKFLVLSCPWKLNDDTKLLPPDAFSVLWMVPKSFCGRGSARSPLGELTAFPRPPSWRGRGSLLLPKSRILSIVNEMTTLCVSVKASGNEVILGTLRW